MGGDQGGVQASCCQVLEVALAEARRASRAKDEFLALLGHELRNPLAPILTALELMAMRGDQAVTREREVIARQTDRLVRLVDDLLDVARIARGTVALTRQRLELEVVLARSIETTSPLLEERGHRLTIACAPGLLVDGDAHRLEQVFTNLMINAAKYTPRGGRIDVTSAAEDAEVVIRVRDNGVGIAAEALPHVFEMFTQEGPSIERSQGGLGLGLAIVHALVALHGGHVRAHSAGRDQGSELEVRLPAWPADASVPPRAA